MATEKQGLINSGFSDVELKSQTRACCFLKHSSFLMHVLSPQAGAPVSLGLKMAASAVNFPFLAGLGEEGDAWWCLPCML